MEIWKAIPSLPLYEASSLGRIRSQYRQGRMTPDRILTPSVDKKGYFRVSPSINCKKYTVQVHILIAESFLGAGAMGDCVHHRDGNKQNNVPENLEYMCHCKHTSISKQGEKSFLAKLNKNQVYEIRWLRKLNFINRELSEITGIKESTIQSILERKSWKHI